MGKIKHQGHARDDFPAFPLRFPFPSAQPLRIFFFPCPGTIQLERTERDLCGGKRLESEENHENFAKTTKGLLSKCITLSKLASVSPWGEVLSPVEWPIVDDVNNK